MLAVKSVMVTAPHYPTPNFTAGEEYFADKQSPPVEEGA